MITLENFDDDDIFTKYKEFFKLVKYTHELK